MESLNFRAIEQKIIEKNKATRINSWYEEVKNVADHMKEPIGKWMKTFAGWQAQDVYKVYLSAEALSKQESMPFSKALNWHLKEIKH